MTTTADRTGEGGVLLTGATGFLGMELLARYLERTDRPVFPLIRAPDEDVAKARLHGLLEVLFGRADAHADRVVPLVGDVERDGAGLAPAARDLVRSEVGEIVHCAATVTFTAGLSESRRINVEGTRNVLGLARRCARDGILRRFAHVSTAYVAGEHRGSFGEDDLDVGQRFRNPYERSKYEAEHLVRGASGDLPSVTIVRPSIIVGDSRTGWTSAFNVIYVPLRAFAARKLKVLPAEPSAPVDVVPVDHVADSILELTSTEEKGLHTYHLVAGERATTVGNLVEMSASRLRRRPPPIVPPRLYRLAYPMLLACSGSRRRAALERAAPFLPYYTMGVRYRRDQAARRLDPVGLCPPPLDSYYDRLLDYATASDWGKRPLPRRITPPRTRSRRSPRRSRRP
jgi:thioester reductase-like protein